MPWSYKTHRDLHAAFAATSVGAILEMAGGADRNHFVITAAMIGFSFSIPINFYGWVTLNDELFFSDEDQARFFAASPAGLPFLATGAAFTLFGLWNLVYYFTPVGAWLLGILIVFFAWYETGIRSPGYTASKIWIKNITREARLEEWRSQTGKGPKDFDWFIERLQRSGMLPKAEPAAPDAKVDA